MWLSSLKDASANKPNTLCAASWKAHRPGIPRASRIPRAGPPPGHAPSASPAPCFPLTPQAPRPDGHGCDTVPILWGRASQPCPSLDGCGPLSYLPTRPKSHENVTFIEFHGLPRQPAWDRYGRNVPVWEEDGEG